MTPWVRHTLDAYRFNTSCQIPGVVLSNSAVVEHSIPACTSRPAAGRTMPKMSGIHASPTVRCLGQQCKDEPGFVGHRWLDLFPRGKGTTSLICIYFPVLSYVNSGKVLARSCLGFLPVYELPSSKHHYPLATTVANLAKLTPE
ncbi:hypothetical protein M405DRAFT_211118 [Rhizopogon salebrosus TDB-379]|nr:hypothetical protein M405DRAFT_211118 [Rhizopogon salebrosus TDB-379]